MPRLARADVTAEALAQASYEDACRPFAGDQRAREIVDPATFDPGHWARCVRRAEEVLARAAELTGSAAPAPSPAPRPRKPPRAPDEAQGVLM